MVRQAVKALYSDSDSVIEPRHLGHQQRKCIPIHRIGNTDYLECNKFIDLFRYKFSLPFAGVTAKLRHWFNANKAKPMSGSLKEI